MRKANICLAVMSLLFVTLFSLVTVHPCFQREHRQRIEAEKQLVATLGLTDLSLFMEARYTRHISQADRHAAFQDHPRALEHFPSGSMVLPPLRLWTNGDGTHDFAQNKESDRR